MTTIVLGNAGYFMHQLGCAIQPMRVILSGVDKRVGHEGSACAAGFSALFSTRMQILRSLLALRTWPHSG
jgi:hypothetical protein